MKKSIALILLSAFLLMSACSLGGKPKVSLLPKSRGSVSVGEEAFYAELDFTGEEALIVLKGEHNVLGTRYYFSATQVRLCYDSLETVLETQNLPDSNLAGLLYKAFKAAGEEQCQFEKVKEHYRFSFKINEALCTGECEENGKLISLEIPQYLVYYKAT